MSARTTKQEIDMHSSGELDNRDVLIWHTRMEPTGS